MKLVHGNNRLENMKGCNSSNLFASEKNYKKSSNIYQSYHGCIRNLELTMQNLQAAVAAKPHYILLMLKN